MLLPPWTIGGTKTTRLMVQVSQQLGSAQPVYRELEHPSDLEEDVRRKLEKE